MTMKIWVLAIGTVLVGIGAGLVSAWLEFAGVPSQFEPHNQAAGAIASSSAQRKGPRAFVVGGTDFDFGVGQRNTKLNHTFHVRNAGDEPLTLEKGATSCKCTLSDLKQGKLAPGETADIRLDWKLVTLGEHFRQTAEIYTNDLQQPTVVLAVHGMVTDMVRLEPPELALTSVTSDAGATETVHIYGFNVKDLQVLSQDFANRDTAGYFTLEWRPATAEELQEKKGATCGLTGTLNIKPGLPLGSINQTIQLKTNIPEVEKLELAVSGSVISDISIVGPSQFNEKHGVLVWGGVQRDRGAKATLRILVKGPHRQDVKLTLQTVDPEDILKVTLGEPQKINEGAVYMYPLNIEIPTRARLVNRMGTEQAKMGKIVIETTHPSAKLLPIYVKFAVE